MSVTVYTTWRGKNALVSQAFADGAGGRVVSASDGLQDDGRPVVVYGVLGGLTEILEAARAEGRDWYYLDNGYLGYGRYFRATRNARQLPATGGVPADFDRLKAHALPWQPWRRNGEHVLIVQQSPKWYPSQAEGLTRERWTAAVIRRLQPHTQRELRVRPKDCTRRLDSDLRRAWATVTQGSAVAIDGVVRGVPAIVTGDCPALHVGTADFARVEDPPMPEDRETWAARLAANQWTLDEMRSGLAWRNLQEALD